MVFDLTGLRKGFVLSDKEWVSFGEAAEENAELRRESDFESDAALKRADRIGKTRSEPLILVGLDDRESSSPGTSSRGGTSGSLSDGFRVDMIATLARRYTTGRTRF